VILGLTILVEHRLATDGDMMTAYTVLAQRRTVIKNFNSNEK